MGKNIEVSTLTAGQLRALEIMPREAIMGTWLLQGDLGFIFAPRGMGKTWFSLLLAIRISEGGKFHQWETTKPRRVLYVDGEMALDAIRLREKTLSERINANLYFLHHEQLFQQTGAILNLSADLPQQALLAYCIKNKIEVVFLDNLSCLFSGIKENDADSWETVLPWLLQFRRLRISVVIIHHAGRNGLMRGTSRREDAANWIIQLSKGEMEDCEGQGAQFAACFTKNRNATDAECTPFSCAFKKTLAGITIPIFKNLAPLDIVRHCVEVMGLTSATDIAEEIGISKGQVSKLAKKAMDAGWLTKNGREYAITHQAPLVSKAAS